MKSLSIVILLSLFAFTGCGGSGGSGGNNEDEVSIKNINLEQRNLSFKNKIGITDTNSTTALRGLRDLNVSKELIALDTNFTVQPIYSQIIDIKDYAIPSQSISSNTKYLVSSGNFNVDSLETNITFECNLIVSKLTIDNNATCIYSKKSSDSSDNIPVATFRAGNVDGYIDADSSVYFVVNKTIDGFDVYKYNGVDVQTIYSSSIGKITKLFNGNKSLLGVDEITETPYVLFGNEYRGFQFYQSVDRILPYESFILNPKIGLFYTLNDATSTSYASEFQVNAKSPISTEYTAAHSYGIFWIASDSKYLYEAYKLTNRPEPIAYRVIDESSLWQNIKISNDIFVGIRSVDGTNQLIINVLTNGLQTLGEERTMDFTNKLNDMNLDSVESLGYFNKGVVVTGIKNSILKKIYIDTTTHSINIIVPNENTREFINLKSL